MSNNISNPVQPQTNTTGNSGSSTQPQPQASSPATTPQAPAPKPQAASPTASFVDRTVNMPDGSTVKLGMGDKPNNPTNPIKHG